MCVRKGDMGTVVVVLRGCSITNIVLLLMVCWSWNFMPGQAKVMEKSGNVFLENIENPMGSVLGSPASPLGCFGVEGSP